MERARALLALPVAADAPSMADEPTILAVILAHAQSPAPDPARMPRPASSVLKTALGSIQHVDKIVPRFLNVGPASDNPQRLGLTPATVARVVTSAGGDAEAIPISDETIGWSRAYELFWFGLGAARDARLAAMAARSARAAETVATLKRTLDTLETVDALVTDDRCPEAFLLCRARLDEGLACFATRHAALCLHLASDLPSMKTAMAGARPLLPKPMLDAVESLIDARVAAALGDAASPALAEYFAYLPPCYWVLTGRQRDDRIAFEDVVATWSLLQRAEVNPDAKIGSAIVVRGIPKAGRAAGPIIVLNQDVALPPCWLSILPRFVPPVGRIVLERRRIAENPRQSLVAGTVEHGRMTIGAICARPSDLGLVTDKDVAEEPIAIVQASARDQAPSFDAVTVIGGADDSPAIIVPAMATCAEALAAIDAHFGPSAAETLPCLVRSPAIGYPFGYAQRLHARYEQNARHAAIAAAGVALDREDRIVLDRRSSDGMLLPTTPIALACASLADLRASLVAQHDRRFYDALLLSRLPAIFVRLDRDVAAGNELTVLAGLESEAEAGGVRQVIFERERRGLARWLNSAMTAAEASTGPFLDLLGGHERLMSDVASFVRGDRGAKTMQAAKSHLRRGSIATLVAEDEIALLRGFVQAACDEGDFLVTLDGAALRMLFDLGRRVGIQAATARSLVGHAARVVLAVAGATGEVFAYLAGAMERDAFAAAFLTALNESLARPTDTTTRELVTMFAAYASPDALALALDIVARSPHARLLDDPSLLASTLPDRSTPPPAIVRVGLTMEAVRASAPIADQLHRAIGDGTTRETLIGLMRRKVEEDGSLEALVDLLRVYSATLAPMAITSTDWAYPIHGHPDQVIRLAAALADEAVIRRLRPDANEEGRALANAAIGEQSELDRIVARLGECHALSPVTFAAPAGIEALFAHILALPHGEPRADGPLVSVIMTVFEPDPALLDLAMRSVLEQTHEAVELLLVDDGNADGAAMLLAASARLDPRMRLLTMPHNAGAYACRNLALRHARGEFVAIHDADDIAHPQRIQVQLDSFARRPELFACASRHLRFDALGHAQVEQNGALFGDGTMTTMFRRAAFEKLGGFLPIRSRGDVEFRGRLRRVFGPDAIMTLPCPLMYCHSGPATLSHRVYRERRQALQDFRRAFRLLEWEKAEDGTGRSVGRLVIPWSLRP